jgi:hypothetical protein
VSEASIFPCSEVQSEVIGIGCHLICIAFGVNITLMYFNRDAVLDTVFYEHKVTKSF